MKLYTYFLAFSIISIFILLPNEMVAQNDAAYKTAVGTRFGSPYLSGSYKTFLNEKVAMEAYVGYRGYSSFRWISISAAGQIHNPIPEVLEGLQWYYGAGASVYIWTFDNAFIENSASTSYGINGYLGLDYKVPGKPVAISIDWVPTFFLNGYGSGFGSGYGGIGVRYVLK